MSRALREVWRGLPDAVRHLALRTGLPYAVRFAVDYATNHSLENFAGNLEDVKRAYREGDAAARAKLASRFDSIVDRLVMPNGVQKTTYAARQTQTLAAVLDSGRARLPGSEIRVLDVPASTGIASLDSYALLSRHYRVASYVLGDLYHVVLYDAQRRCVFDERGNLLQVALGKRYFSIHREATSGNEYTVLTRLLLWPHSMRSRTLRRRYRLEPGHAFTSQLVVHPEVEPLIADGVFRVEQMDVFQPIPGCYDVILSFNLLQRSYFPQPVIARGLRNLTAALTDGGLLIMGNTESFVVLQKRQGALAPVMRQGRF